MDKIRSVIKDFIFFVQPKWKIASDTPGSGNTRNIGSVTKIAELVNGTGPFAKLGKEVFDNYWKGYFNKTDAKNAGIGTPPYNNLKTYKEHLERLNGLLNRLTKWQQ